MEKYTTFIDWKNNTVKMTILPKIIYRYNAVSIKIPMALFMKLGQIILKFVWKPQKNLKSKTISREQNRAGGITLPDFTLKLQSSKHYYH